MLLPIVKIKIAIPGRRFGLVIGAVFIAAFPVFSDTGRDQPNVIMILVDDQGYGDVAAHGNPVLKTPHLDKLHGESVRLTDYHVDPTCSPTRSALLTGRYSTRTGVWHTINGRSLLHPDEFTLAEYFRDNGYRTGMFGKWHLGSAAPLRPMDQGFDHCVWSPGGAINQGANWLGNDCFDDTYKVNEAWRKFDGYFTDVFFDEAMKFIGARDTPTDRPFFVYLPTPAVHDPWNVDDKYARPYRDMGLPEAVAKFYGMVTNVDENVGRLRSFLQDHDLADNTILIFTTDNGTAIGWSAGSAKYDFFNAGMRDWKGSEYEGGHRVPFMIHWPAGGIREGRDEETLCQHIDVWPTLAALCGLDPVAEGRLKRGPLDGVSLAPLLLKGVPAAPGGVRFVHSQRTSTPIKWRKSAVMTEQYRLINGRELYDIVADPGQTHDIAHQHPDLMEQLRGDYDKWWASLEPVFSEHVRFDIGGVENPTTLMSHDWFMEGENPSIWHHNYIHQGRPGNGPFMVHIVKAGKYRITPMRWPEYVDKPSGCVKAEVTIQMTDRQDVRTGLPLIQASTPLDPTLPAKALVVDLPAGPAALTTTMTRVDGSQSGGYYVKLEWIGVSE